MWKDVIVERWYPDYGSKIRLELDFKPHTVSYYLCYSDIIKTTIRFLQPVWTKPWESLLCVVIVKSYLSFPRPPRWHYCCPTTPVIFRHRAPISQYINIFLKELYQLVPKSSLSLSYTQHKWRCKQLNSGESHTLSNRSMMHGHVSTAVMCVIIPLTYIMILHTGHTSTSNERYELNTLS